MSEQRPNSALIGTFFARSGISNADAAQPFPRLAPNLANDKALYIYCLKCDNKIPARLRCRGNGDPAHKGLWFQRCNNCSYFAWIPPPQSDIHDPYAINPGQGFGENDPFDRNEAFRSPTPGSPQIDPTLLASSLPSTPTVSNINATPINADTAKRSCSRPLCGRLATAKTCSNAMCKTCCQARNQGCAYTQHRNVTPTVAANGNPSALARPPAVIPTPSSTSSLPLDGPASLPLDGPVPPAKLYRKPMDDVWAAQYKAGLSSQQKKKVEKEEKRVEARRLLNKVGVCYFPEDNTDPEHYREQDITTFPYLNLSKLPRLLRKMKLTPEDEVGIYDFAAGLWRSEDVNTTFQVVAGQTLLVRAGNVTRCADLDRMITLHNPGRKSGKSVAAKRKPDHERDPSNRVVQVARTTQNRYNNSASCSIPRSPSPALSVSSSFPSASNLLSLSKKASTSATLIDLIDLSASSPSSSPSSSRRWSRSSTPEAVIKPEPMTDSAAGGVARPILVLAGFGSWPAEVYARDMARAFGQISKGRSADSDVESRFGQLFPGVPFVKPTYSRQLQFWRGSTQQERDAAERMPRNSRGFWTTWREGSSGMKAFKSRQKNKN
ncbi:hypothetical protein DFH09DRAFT_1329055 [Mycena vulgaris]|nr:hypothetical protein DFH09DRAFT_1329055 [Mycena vulgaris]